MDLSKPMLPRSAYIHVPFCAHHCGYCNFSVIAGRNDLAEEYIDAVAWELEQLPITPGQATLDTLYFGGGTPTQLTADQFRRLFAAVTSWLPISEKAEITVEANPADVETEKLATMAALGVNRISLGSQSFHDQHLRTLQRDHASCYISRVTSLIRKACIASVFLDLIFAVPGQSLADWRADLAAVIELAPQHVSTYGLTFEKGAAFYGRLRSGDLQEADENLQRDMYLAAIDTLTAAGFEHYEVSNFARPGRRSRHNEVYWTGQTFWAFGPGAARFVDGRRATNHRSVTTYLQRIRGGQSPVAEVETLSPEDAASERLVFDLSRLESKPPTEIQAQTGYAVDDLVGDQLPEFVRLGLLHYADDRLRLTPAGLLVSDSIWPAFL